ncbi:replication protein A 70 kDa DNA-binding subunit B-like [Chenopodium quinoa]|uniref:replication protein A 70 kDa DNA-binding subunit B-like n=1 Tax=Chenopodium quinoa TaxID=63459 RepID=UPI000B7718BC|nr:replication protein A 70 kDa DNA-binding subunit B-like [Chenopodium quinoa]
MRLWRSDVPSDTLEQIREFAYWIIKVGGGVIAGVPITEEGNEHKIHTMSLYYPYNIECEYESVFIFGWSMSKVELEGDEVQITLFNADIDKYKEILKQGKVYSIAQLDLMPLYTSYKYSNNQMRLKFGNKTMITEILDDCDDIPRYNFMFIEFCHIPQYLHMRNSPLIDVIGLVIYVSESYRVSGGRQQFKRDVLLCNTNMETMRLTLREGFAYDQGRFLFNELNQDHVLGASMVSVGSYYGACFSTVGRTRLFIDPDIDETDDLHGWYADDGYVQKQIS